MSLISIIIFTISLLGVLLGLALSYIAPEELDEGKKYLLWLKKGLFIIIFLVVNYYFFMNDKLTLLIIFNVLAVILFVIEWNRFKISLEISNYIFLAIAYFLHTEQNFNLILASLIFLYGFPLGSLLRTKII